MNRPTMARDDADPAFEAALRAMLSHRDDAAASQARVRALLDGALAEAKAGPGARWWGSGSRLIRLAGGLAAVLVVGLVGLIGWSAFRGGVVMPAGPQQAIDWDTGSVRLAADGLAIRAGGRTFMGPQRPTLHSDPGSPTYRTLEATWQAGGTEMRLNLYFAADDHDWWVTEVRTGDGLQPLDWVSYPGPLFKTPLGGTWVGDVDLSSSAGKVPGRLTILGLHLTAFSAGTGPAPFVGCRVVGPLDDGSTDPLAVGQPLAGSGIENMTPVAAESLLRSMRICHTYRFEYPTGPAQGYSEVWCVPPPGKIISLFYGTRGEVVVSVSDAVRVVRSPRPQPPAGWGCNADTRALFVTDTSAPAGPASSVPSVTAAP